MFALADLIVMNAIEDGLENLRKNPYHLEFILGKFEDSLFMRKLHGTAYVRQCKELIIQNRIFVKPYYVLDMNKLPSISVIAQYSEDMNVLGDYGMEEKMADIPPVVLGSVMGVGWDEGGYGLVAAANVTEWIYAGAYLEQDNFKSRIDYVLPNMNGQTCTIFCKDELPRKRLIDWRVVTSDSSRIAILHSSGNAASVSIDLKSCGDIETHKLLGLVLRYCLKRGRLLMDAEGLQITTASQNYPSLYDEDQQIFQSVFNLSGKIWDTWISHEVNNDRYENLTMCVEPPEQDGNNMKVGGFVI